LLEASTNVL
jgi:hypothetical protein